FASELQVASDLNDLGEAGLEIHNVFFGSWRSHSTGARSFLACAGWLRPSLAVGSPRAPFFGKGRWARSRRRCSFAANILATSSFIPSTASICPELSIRLQRRSYGVERTRP